MMDDCDTHYALRTAPVGYGEVIDIS